MLMHADGRAVDHLHIALVGGGDGIHQPIPDARFAPAYEAVVAGRVGAITLRKIAPRRARAQHPKDAVQNPSVIDPRYAARPIGQQRRDRLPFEFRQLVSAHDPAPAVRKLESHPRRRGNPFYEFMT